MKRCPECRRDYYDDTLLYCLEDGVVLVQGLVASPDALSLAYEPPTAMIHSSGPADGGLTQVLEVTAPSVERMNAIAVLPFANMSGNEDAEYLSDGLAEELLNVLSRIQGLRVAGRMSAFSFKGKQATFDEIGRKLNVSSVLDGSVRMAGNRVRISVQLINVADGYHLWSETYDRTMDDIFAIQDDIASSVIEQLQSRLTTKATGSDPGMHSATEVVNTAKARAVDPEAHRLMLLARHIGEQRTPESMAIAVKYLEEGLEIDPQNAQCWLRLGNAQTFRASHNLIGYEEGYRAARAAAERALSLEPDLAGAHTLLSKLNVVQERDFRGADESMRRALELEPENVAVLQAAGFVVRFLGGLEESLEIGRKLIAMDPLNWSALQMISYSAYSSGVLVEAETAIRRALEVAPKGVYGHALLAVVLATKGQIDDARTEAASEPAEVWRHWAMALVEVAAGNGGGANAAVDRLIQQGSEDFAFQIAEVYSAMGESDKAFEYLHTSIETDPGIAQVLISPQLRPLHSDPRWQPLLRKIGIPEEYWPEL